MNLPGDIDRDGDLDVVQGGYNPPIVWLEYRGPTDWVVHVIDSTQAGLDPNGVLHDVDGDGDLDLIGGGNQVFGGGLYWWQCPADPAQPWTRRVIETWTGQHHDQAVGDLDGDGRKDLVFWHQETQRVYWVEIPPDPRVSPWPNIHLLAWDLPGEGLAILDLTGNGVNDVLAGSYWLEKPADPTERWLPHRIASGFARERIAVGDVNGDDRLDVVYTEGDVNVGKLSWYSATDPWGSWTEHRLRSDLYRAHTLELLDFDLDGDLDIFTGEMDNDSNTNAEILLWENSDGAGSFVQRTLHVGLGIHEGKAADIDRDGDIDLVGKTFAGWNDTNAEWWENTTVTGELSLDRWDRVLVDTGKGSRTIFVIPAAIDGDYYPDIVTGRWWYENPRDPFGDWVRREIPFLGEVGAVFDVDGDGDMDVFGTKGSGSAPNSDLLWVENTGGGTAWVLHDDVQSLGGTFLQGVAVGDFVAGGWPEVALSWHDAVDGVHLLEIPPDPAGPWTNRKIAAESQGEELSNADIDGDGDLDLMMGTKWLENPGTGGTWTTRTMSGTDPVDEPDRNRMADIDGDGDLDVVVGEEAGSVLGDVVWFERPANPRGTWPAHLIGRVIGPMSLDLADLDGDGDTDVVVGEHALSDPSSGRVIIGENIDGGSIWWGHLVDTGYEHHDGTQLVDIDRDGDLDIVSISWSNPGIVLLYVNRSWDPSVWVNPDPATSIEQRYWRAYR